MGIASAFSFIITFLAFSVSAASINPCPHQADSDLISLEVFDGTAAENFSLAPAPKDQNNGVWNDLEAIYRQGRKLTIACGYQNGLLLNVEINNPVTQCSSSDIHGLNILCQLAVAKTP